MWPWTHRGRHRPHNGPGHDAELAAARSRLAREERKLAAAEERTDQIDRLALDVRRALGLGGNGR